jgi:hypothetical protein
MTDRESIMFLTRGTEALVQRGRDIRYMQEHQDNEHVRLLQDLLGVVERMRHAILGEIREFAPQVQPADVERIGNLQEQAQAQDETKRRMEERDRKLQALNRLPRNPV